MSTSRLEKFIYAICSMEVSDLPAPLSRIEILWNCLITGETPDFEPQSRNERYLMAILGLHELESLPTPMSRVEKLLYKIAMGETDLSDVPAYLSRYEELLGYLIENGGSGNFEYVIYTLNQQLSTLYSTKERPVKSAILKGCTLVNKMNNARYRTNIDVDVKPNSNNEFIYTYADGLGGNILPLQTSVFEPNKIYTIILFLDEIGDGGLNKIHLLGGKDTMLKIGINKALYTTSSSINDNDYSHNTQIRSSFKAKYVIVEGDYTNVDIPYFDGMQSVKMPVLKATGKNTFNIKNKGASRSGWYSIPLESPFNGEVYVKGDNSLPSDFRVSILAIHKNEHILTNDIVKGGHTSYYQNLTDIEFHCPSLSIEEDSRGSLDDLIANGYIVIELGGEPYKSNILSTPEDLELRGIGDVQDTLDCLTGEVTERIGEVVLNGSESWSVLKESNNAISFKIPFTNFPNYNKILCSVLKTQNPYLNPDDEGIWHNNSGQLQLTLLKTKVSNVDSLKTYLAENNITFHHQLAESVIKTVDLTTIDQDGQPTKLKTFNDVTHVEINSVGIIPTVELHAATKIEETISTMGLQHNDISETQNELSQNIDEQVEDTDAAMLATTEIYEKL